MKFPRHDASRRFFKIPLAASAAPLVIQIEKPSGAGVQLDLMGSPKDLANTTMGRLLIFIYTDRKHTS